MSDPRFQLQDFLLDIGVKRLAAFNQMHALARIDHDDAFPAVDEPRVCRKPLGPVWVGENREPPSQAGSSPLDMRGLYPDGAGFGWLAASR
jgi:hypothetical protein